MIKKFFQLLKGDSGEDKKSPAKPSTKAPATKSPTTPKKKEPAPKKGPAKPVPVSNKPDLTKKSAEAMCGIDPKKMKKEEIREKLAELYKRHNHAAGSLNNELREEAEKMLDAIVECREKYVDGIKKK